ncbi:hypothetical protein MKW94_001989 [Papaver nudicaule]|uniref:Uncharacterized protein n=1 Tax=Papaver nudicaule TaxID=74823 RepID=A0AA41RNL8_PAPNU|nr:hypothetical protein [Papaver nudicaule]
MLNHTIFPLGHLPNDTPMRHDSHHGYPTLGAMRGLHFGPPGQPQLFDRNSLNERCMVAILLNPTLFRTCTRRIISPARLMRFLSSTTTFNRQRYDNLTYRSLRKRRITVKGNDEHGPVILIDSQIRVTTDDSLTRYIHTAKSNGVDYRIIEYFGLAAAAAVPQQNPLVVDQLGDVAVGDVNSPPVDLVP